jgi:hypothetical protein
LDGSGKKESAAAVRVEQIRLPTAAIFQRRRKARINPIKSGASESTAERSACCDVKRSRERVRSGGDTLEGNDEIELRPTIDVAVQCDSLDKKILIEGSTPGSVGFIAVTPPR